ncbi:hypothetical protein NYO99_11820 [Pelomonas sp. UHG3]|uniref:Uncharacterized protein n=1 Tax=Roseateles hydrophilus TaxID=2975054 RepID=A0ACC6CBB7_9BURK|nr:hypothetical protein [Pelomonas sp. UHG3]MCY4745662.1 hypothetical protein [Pelomonas sp. UHG3]
MKVAHQLTGHATPALAILATALFTLSPAHAQQYTGAGSTLQPSVQYQQMQREQARRAQQYYYVQAPPAPQQRQAEQSKFMYPDSSLRAIGFPPVPVQMSPQAIDRISERMPRCMAGAAFGYAQGGRRGAAVGFVQGCSGW